MVLALDVQPDTNRFGGFEWYPHRQRVASTLELKPWKRHFDFERSGSLDVTVVVANSKLRRPAGNDLKSERRRRQVDLTGYAENFLDFSRLRQSTCRTSTK